MFELAEFEGLWNRDFHERFNRWRRFQHDLQLAQIPLLEDKQGGLKGLKDIAPTPKIG